MQTALSKNRPYRGRVCRVVVWQLNLDSIVSQIQLSPDKQSLISQMRAQERNSN